MGTPEAAPSLGERAAQMHSIRSRALSLQQRIQEQVGGQQSSCCVLPVPPHL